MKIGIMTFHWATNHGAIIQAYALQKYLQDGHPNDDVQIIDYYPERYKKGVRSIFRSIHPAAIRKNYKEYRKDRILQEFRNILKKTEHYSTIEELNNYASDFDIVICGSDQIWNEFFTFHGERKITTAYFLSFCPNSKKIAYAASFGFQHMNKEMQAVVRPLLKEFFAISVRETSGVKILEDMNIPCERVCDPTFLLNKPLYEKIAQWKGKEKIIAKYILRKQSDAVELTIKTFISKMERIEVVDLEMLSIETWLGAISHANCCITNSFHCSVFSILFHIPFYVIQEENHRSGMNDRLTTLLGELGLTERIIQPGNPMPEMEKTINWEKVEKKLAELTVHSKNFLLKNCFGDSDDD